MRTPPSMHDLTIIPGGMTSQSQVFYVVTKSFGDLLHCLGGEGLLSGNFPSAGNKKTNMKHCFGSGLRLLGMTFHQDLGGR